MMWVHVRLAHLPQGEIELATPEHVANKHNETYLLDVLYSKYMYIHVTTVRRGSFGPHQPNHPVQFLLSFLHYFISRRNFTVSKKENFLRSLLLNVECRVPCESQGSISKALLISRVSAREHHKSFNFECAHTKSTSRCKLTALS